MMMTKEQIDSRTAKIRAYYASEPPEKKAERIEKIKAYHRAVHRKRATEQRARVARADTECNTNIEVYNRQERHPNPNR